MSTISFYKIGKWEGIFSYRNLLLKIIYVQYKNIRIENLQNNTLELKKFTIKDTDHSSIDYEKEIRELNGVV